MRYSITLLFLASFSLLFTIGIDASANIEIGEPITRNFDPDEYGGHGQVWAVIEDRRGVMYFGTTSGILEFDGHNWRKLTIDGDGTVRSLAISEDGTIYFGGIDEIGYLGSDRHGQLTYQSLKKKIPTDDRKFKNIWSIRATSHGIYFGTNEKVFRWFKNKFSVIPIPDSSGRIVKIVDDIFQASPRGIARISKSGLTYLPNSKMPHSDFGAAYFSPHQGSDQLFIITQRRGCFLYDKTKESNNSGLIPFATEVDEYLKTNIFVGRVAEVSDSLYAIGTLKGGIAFIDSKGKLLQVFNKNRGLQNDTIWSMHEDRHSNLWIATNDGISHMSLSSPLTRFTELSGVESSVLTVTRHAGQIYLGTYSHGPLVLPKYKLANNDDRHDFLAMKDTVATYAWDFLSTENALLTSSLKLLVIEDNQASTVKDCPSTRCLGQTGKFPHHIFLGINRGGGLGILKILDNSVETESGLSLDRSKLKFEYAGKLPHIKETVQDIVTDKHGNLWLSCELSGIIQIIFNGDSVREFEIVRYTTAHGLPDMHGNRVFWDSDKLLVATEKGIYKGEPGSGSEGNRFRFFPEDRMNLFDSGPTAPVKEIIKYDENKLLINRSTQLGFLNQNDDGNYTLDTRPFPELAIAHYNPHIDPDGVLWIPTRKGLYRWDPTKQKNYNSPFACLIRRVESKSGVEIFKGTNYDANSIMGKVYGSFTQTQPAPLVPTLEYEENSVTFSFAAPYFEYGDKIEFQYRLLGSDKDWSDWSKDTKKGYTNLPEGKYRFQVRAKNIYDSISRTAEYKFSVLPPWYRTIYAYVAYLFAFLLLTYVGIQLNTRRLIIAKSRLEKIVRRRTQEVVQQKEEIAHQRDQIKQANEALFGEMELAKKLQTVLLPEDPQIHGYEICTYMKTADEVGGDYYDIINTDQRDWLVIGDVSGHGVSAGLVMMMVQSVMHAVLQENPHGTPENILRSVNSVILENIRRLGESKYMTLTLMSLASDGTIHYSGLHQDIFVYRNHLKKVETVETQGIWLGVVDDIDKLNTVDIVKLNPDDKMLLFTDGISEARNAKGETYSDKRLKTVFEQNGNKGVADIRDSILNSLDGYTCEDDITLVVLSKNS